MPPSADSSVTHGDNHKVAAGAPPSRSVAAPGQVVIRATCRPRWPGGGPPPRHSARHTASGSGGSGSLKYAVLVPALRYSAARP